MSRADQVAGASAAVGRVPTNVDRLVAIVLAVVGLVVLVGTMDTGFTRDEGYYFRAAETYLGWFDELGEQIDAGTPLASFSQASIDRHFSANAEHPALPKVLFGLSYWLFAKKLDVLDDGTAMRLPGALSCALLLAMVYLFVAPRFGRTAALFATVAVFLMPRPFWHAHLACFDYMMVTAWFAVVWAWWRSWSSTGWAVVCGLLFGLALSIKHNAFFIPATLMVHWLIVAGATTSLQRRNGEWRLRLPRMPVALVAMAVLGPLVWYLLWPRHWFDTFNRIKWYFDFHLQHVHYFQYYFGDNLYTPPFPVEFPFVMSLLTMPEVTLLAVALGSAVLLGRWLRREGGGRWAPLARVWGALPADPRGTGWLIALNALVPFVVIALPNTPIFGGIKHWMPAMPFVAIIAGVGAGWAIDGVLTTMASSTTVRTTGAVLLTILLSLPAALSTAHSHGHGPAFYNTLIGGARGAADADMMRQFWGHSSFHALGFLNDTVRPRGSVFFQNTNHDCYRMYQRVGVLRNDIRYGSMPSSDFGMIHHQMAARTLEIDIWEAYHTRNPAFVGAYDGVPVISVYRRHPRPTPVRPVRSPALRPGEVPGLLRPPNR